ncbi:11331_t:CDS:2 [Entrophospora sp. SA101]|nr:11331_t:CDS:2 [Entrophospora sp. SA101]
MVHQGSCKETLLHLHLLRESSSVSYPLQSKIADVLMDTKLKDYSDEHIKALHMMEIGPIVCGLTTEIGAIMSEDRNRPPSVV